MALGILLVSSAAAQVIEDTIVLPDTFGPLPGPLHGANGTWVTLYYQDMGYSFRRRTAGLLPRGNA
jgi:hypothetical protein